MINECFRRVTYTITELLYQTQPTAADGPITYRFDKNFVFPEFSDAHTLRCEGATIDEVIQQMAATGVHASNVETLPSPRVRGDVLETPVDAVTLLEFYRAQQAQVKETFLPERVRRLIERSTHEDYLIG